jgi:hypothetical protein
VRHSLTFNDNFKNKIFSDPESTLRHRTSMTPYVCTRIFVASLFVAVACSSPSPASPDAGTNDIGVTDDLNVAIDARDSSLASDTGNPTSDLGMPTNDGVTPTSDLGTPTSDLGTPTTDLGMPMSDAGTVPTDAPTVFEVLPVGAGGWLTGIDIHPSGTPRLVRTDTYGAWRWDTDRWTQVVSATSMPASEVALEASNGGVHEIVSAPSDANTVYMAFRGRVFVSTDQARRWQRTAFAPVAMDGNDAWRQSGDKIAVDPLNRDVVFVGTSQDGLWRSTNRGMAWERVASVPAGMNVAMSGDTRGPGITGLIFHRRGPTAGGRTQVLYASSWGNGIYRSTDGGQTFALVGGTNAPRGAWRNAIANDGTLWVVNDVGVFKLSGSTWTNVSPQSRAYDSVVVDPTDSARAYVFEQGGTPQRTTTGGREWTRLTLTRTAVGDVPWHAFTEESYMSVGEVVLNPTNTNELFFAQGIGVWRGAISNTATNIEWRAESRGIEQLVANDIVHAPGGTPVVAAWDRAIFRIAPSGYPERHMPTERFNSAWTLDWTPAQRGFLVANVSDHRYCCESDGLSSQAGYSTDDGRTWTPFATQPGPAASAFGFGNLVVAAGSTDNLVWMPSSNRTPRYTLDRGRSWLPVTLPGIPGTDTGSHFALFLNRHVLVADKVAPATFYLAHSGGMDGVGAGLLRSTDGGRTWQRRFNGELTPFAVFNAQLEVDPRREGVLFFTPGALDGIDGPLRRSDDGGMTWRDVRGVTRVFAIAFGKSITPSSVSTMFIAGKVDGVYGIWRSTDDAMTWRNLTTWPTDSLDLVRTLEGDKDVFGTVYIGFNGSGFAVGRVRP